MVMLFAEMRMLAQALAIDPCVVDQALSQWLALSKGDAENPAKYDSERSDFDEWCAAVDELLRERGNDAS